MRWSAHALTARSNLDALKKEAPRNGPPRGMDLVPMVTSASASHGTRPVEMGRRLRPAGERQFPCRGTITHQTQILRLLAETAGKVTVVLPRRRPEDIWR